MMNREPTRLLPSQCTAAPHRTHSCLWSDLIIRCELHRNCLLAADSVPVSSAPSRNSLQAGHPDHLPTHPDIPVPRAPMPPTETMVIGKWRTPPSKLRARATGRCFSPYPTRRMSQLQSDVPLCGWQVINSAYPSSLR